MEATATAVLPSYSNLMSTIPYSLTPSHTVAVTSDSEGDDAGGSDLKFRAISVPPPVQPASGQSMIEGSDASNSSKEASSEQKEDASAAFAPNGVQSPDASSPSSSNDGPDSKEAEVIETRQTPTEDSEKTDGRSSPSVETPHASNIPKIKEETPVNKIPIENTPHVRDVNDTRIGSSVPGDGHVCANCKATETPLWRRGPNGQVLCNACGLYIKARNIHRPLTLKRSPTTKKVPLKNAVGSCPGDGRCNGTGGSQSCGQCPSFLNNTRRNISTADKSDSDVKMISCQNCGTVNTPLWRRDVQGHVICNACGLYNRMHKDGRPAGLQSAIVKRRKRNRSQSGENPPRAELKMQLQESSDHNNGAEQGSVAAGSEGSSSYPGPKPGQTMVPLQPRQPVRPLVPVLNQRNTPLQARPAASPAASQDQHHNHNQQYQHQHQHSHSDNNGSEESNTPCCSHHNPRMGSKAPESQPSPANYSMPPQPIPQPHPFMFMPVPGMHMNGMHPGNPFGLSHLSPPMAQLPYGAYGPQVPGMPAPPPGALVPPHPSQIPPPSQMASPGNAPLMPPAQSATHSVSPQPAPAPAPAPPGQQQQQHQQQQQQQHQHQHISPSMQPAALKQSSPPQTAVTSPPVEHSALEQKPKHSPAQTHSPSIKRSYTDIHKDQGDSPLAVLQYLKEASQDTKKEYLLAAQRQLRDKAAEYRRRLEDAEYQLGMCENALLTINQESA